MSNTSIKKNKGMETNTKKSPEVFQDFLNFFLRWCPGQESNLHGSTPTTPSK